MALSRYQQASQGFLPLPGHNRGRRDTRSDIGADTRITPVARATDPYTPVTKTARAPLWDLVEALKTFEASLGPVLAKQEAKEKEAEAARGEAAFLKANEANFADAVRSGQIPAYASPAFHEAYKAAQGRKLARDYASKIASEYEKWAGRDTDDPSTFSPWIGEQTRAILGSVQDPIVLKHAMPGIRQASSRLGQQHAQYVGERVMDRTIQGITSDVAGAIDNSEAMPTPGEDGKLLSHRGLTDAINAIAAEADRIGVPPDRIQKAIVDTAIAKAIEKGDVEVLLAIPPGMRKTPYAIKAIQQAQDRITQRLYQADRRAEQEAQRARKEGHALATRTAIEIFSRDINAALPEEVIRLGSLGDPKFQVTIEDLRLKMRSQGNKVDPAVEAEAAVRIHTAADPLAQAVKEIKAGNITEPSRVNSILHTAQRLKQSQARGSASVLNDSITRQYARALRESYVTHDILKGKQTDETGYSRALTDFHIALTEWEEQNPGATTIDRMKAIRSIGEEVLKSRPAPAKGRSPQRQGAGSGAQPQVASPAATPKSTTATPPPPAAPAQKDPLLEEIRNANPVLKGVPDHVIRQFLPKAPKPGTPSSQEAPKPGTPSPQEAPKKTSFERLGDSPLMVPKQPAAAPQPAPPTQPGVKRKAVYAGNTYKPARPDDVLELDDREVAYASAPGTTYSRAPAVPPRGIIFHHTASNAPAKAQVEYGQKVDHVRGFQPGYHFYIDKDGTVIQGAPLSARTNHLKSGRHPARTAAHHLHNANSIGISLLGDGKSPTPEQMEAARKVGIALMKRYGITPDNIFGHGEVQRDRQGSDEGGPLARALRTNKE